MKNLFKNKRFMITAGIVFASCLAAVGSIMSYNIMTDVTQAVYSTDGVKIDLTQTAYPGDSSSEVKNIMALSEVPKNPVIRNTGNSEAFAYLAVTIPVDTVALTTYDGSPSYSSLTQLFNYGYENSQGVRESWKLVEEGYFGSTKIIPVSNVLQGASDMYGAYNTENKTVTYIYAYVGENIDVLSPLAAKKSSEALFDYIKVADIEDTKTVDGTTQIVVVDAYAIQTKGTLSGDEYDPSTSSYEDVIKVWDLLNEMTPVLDLNEDENPVTDAVQKKLIDGPSFNSLVKGISNGQAITDIHFGYYTVPEGATTCDVSSKQNGSMVAWYDNGSVYVTDTAGYAMLANEDCSYMFSGMEYLETVEFTSFDTSLAVDMSHMFEDTKSMNYVDISSAQWNTSSVLTMEGMFMGSGIEEVDCESLETENVTSVANMFYGCSRLKGVDTSSMELGNCLNAANMFRDCSNLTVLDLSGFSANSITNMSYLFAGCEKLSTLDITDLNTDKVMNFDGMFQDNIKLREIIGIEDMNVSNGTNLSHMFQGMDAIEELNLSAWNTSNASTMAYMFEGTDNLENLYLSGFSVNSLSYCDYMFANTGLVNIFATDWIDEKTVNNADHMFENSPNLPAFDEEVVDWSKAYVGGYFALPPNTLLQGEKFNAAIPAEATAVVFTKEPIPGVNDGQVMLLSSEIVETVDVSAAQDNSIRGWMDGNTFKCASVDGDIMRTHPDCSNMFYNQDRLTYIDFGVNGIVTSELTFNMRRMFSSMDNLVQINICSLDTSIVENMDNMFSGSPLSTVYVSDLWNTDLISEDAELFRGNNLVGQCGEVAYEVWLGGHKRAANYIDGYFTYYDGNPNTLVSGPNFNTLFPSETTELYFGDYSDILPEDRTQWINLAISGEYSVVGFLDGTKFYVTTLDGSKINTCGSLYKMLKSETVYGPLVKVVFENIDTSDVFNMGSMFYEQGNLAEIDVSCFATGNVTDMSNMFYRVAAKELDLSNFDTKNVITMENMFNLCFNLEGVVMNSFDTPKLTNMNYMFHNCDELKAIDFSSFDTSNVTKMENLFSTIRSNTNTRLKAVYVGERWTTEHLEDNYVIGSYGSSGSLGFSYLLGQNGISQETTSGYNLTAAKANYQTGSFTYYDGKPNTLVAGPEFNQELPAAAKEVYIGDYHDMIPEDKSEWINLSASNDWSVIGFLDGTKFYVTTLDGSMIRTTGNMNEMFYTSYKSWITRVEFSNIDTSGVVGFAKMFYGQNALSYVDISCFDTVSITNTSGMFYFNEKLAELKNCEWKTMNLKYCDSMFCYCYLLPQLDFSSWDVSKVEDMSYMFNSCCAMKEIDLTNWEPVNVKNTSHMFATSRSSVLTTIYAKNWSKYDIEKSDAMFYRGSTSYAYPLTGAITYSGTSSYNKDYANYGTGFFTYITGVKDTVMAGAKFKQLIPTTATAVAVVDEVAAGYTYTDVSELQDESILGWMDGTTFKIASVDGEMIKLNPVCSNMFLSNTKITSVDLTKTDKSMVEYASSMFEGCSKLTAIPAGLEFGEIQSSARMFYGCSSLTDGKTTPISFESNFDTSYMFYNCIKLANLDASQMRMEKVKTTKYMFTSCYGMKSLDLSSWNTESLTDISYMFTNCYGFTSLDVSGIKVENVVDATNCFTSIYNLKELDLSSWNFTKSFTGTNIIAGGNETSDQLTTIYANDWSPYITSSGRFFSNITSLVGDGMGYNADYLNNPMAASPNGFFRSSKPELTTNMMVDGDTFRTMLPSSARIIVFTDHVDSTTITDFSALGDGSVVGWANGSTYYISTTDGSKVIAHPDCSDMFMNKTAITTIDLTNLDTSHVYNMRRMFYGMTNLTSVNIEMMDVSNVVSFSNMFRNATKLTTLDFSGWNTGKAANTDYMFYGCSALAKLNNIDHLDMSSNLLATHMFYGCNALTELDLSDWVFGTSKLRADYMFNSLSKLVRLDLSNWTLPKETISTIRMFNNCPNLYYIYAGDWSSQEFVSLKSTDMFYGLGMMYGASAADIKYANPSTGYFTSRSEENNNTLIVGKAFSASLPGTTKSVVIDSSLAIPESAELTDVSVNYDGSVVGWLDGTTFCVTSTNNEAIIANENCSYMFSGTAVSSVSFGDLDTSKVKNMSYMFNNCTALTSVSLNGLDTGCVENMSYMFYGCSALTNVDFGSINTENVSNMARMFYGCIKLVNLDLSMLNTGKVEDMSYMFYNCYNMTSLNVSGISTKKATTLAYMFYNCKLLSNIDVSSFNTDNVVDLSYMFYSCAALEEIDASQFNVSKVTSFNAMFDGCTLLITTDLSGWYPAKLSTCHYMFRNCKALTTIYAGNWNGVKASASGTQMFTNCTSLVGAINYSASYVTYAYANPYTGYFTQEAGTAYRMKDGATINSTIPTTATAIYIGDYSSSIPDTATDLSMKGDGTVLGWSDGTEYYITTNDGSKVVFHENCQNMFLSKTAVTKIIIDNVDTSNVVNMRNMFACSSQNKTLTEITLNGFDTKNVTDMGYMFRFRSSLPELNISGWDVRNVQSMDYMFHYCQALQTLDLTGWEVYSVTNTNYMFHTCSALNTIYSGDWTSMVETKPSSNYMFTNASALKGAISYNSGKTDWTYANSTTGYFSVKQ